MPSLMEKIGNRFPREVNAFAAEKHIPVLALKKPDRSRWDDRKLDYVRPCLTAAEEQGRSAVVAIVAAHGCTSMRSERAPLLQVRRARKDGKRRWMTTTGPDFGGWGQRAPRRDPIQPRSGCRAVMGRALVVMGRFRLASDGATAGRSNAHYPLARRGDRASPSLSRQPALQRRRVSVSASRGAGSDPHAFFPVPAVRRQEDGSP